MSLQSDHKALLFFASVAVLGAGVRVVRASARSSAGASQPALDRQVQAADSAAHAGRARPGAAGRGSTKRGKTKRPATSDTDSAAQRSMPRQARRGSGPLDRPGWIAGKLDLDVATAVQIDSLPGVTPLMAKRIAADRMARGPFLDRNGLRRVPGVGPRFLAAIDSLVTFSGTYAQASPGDSTIPRPKSTRGRKTAHPPP
jgi:competence protein ComEA